MSTFPTTRMRRLRQSEPLRAMVRETSLGVQHLIYPLFISETITRPKDIPSMPGIMQWNLEHVLYEVQRVSLLGVPALLLFGIPAEKDDRGSQAYHPDGIIQRAIRLIKQRFPNMIVITDVCLCEYTSHGHCGMIDGECIQNDELLPLIAEMALSHARAGADIVAPSDMMDGRVGAIRTLLDTNNFTNTPIMAYSAKYASCFYNPFRDAAESPPSFGDRRSYQMDTANVREALREVDLDILEGADMVMVKPALAYLDVLQRVREHCNLPLVAYNVSGEYAMIQAAARNGWLDERKATMEIVTSIRRAGADMIITYSAPKIAEWLRTS